MPVGRGRCSRGTSHIRGGGHLSPPPRRLSPEPRLDRRPARRCARHRRVPDTCARWPPGPLHGLRLRDACLQLVQKSPLSQVSGAQPGPMGRGSLATYPTVHYFHLVFTLPSELHSLAYNNRAAIFALLFRSAADTLLSLASDPSWLGKDAQLGITAVLHTWTRELCFHPHVHCIVTGGGLAHDKSQWVPAPRDFLLPVHVVGALFRGKFMAGLQELLDQGELHDDVPCRAARRRRQRLHKTSWVVYAKRPFGGPEQVFRYLGRYTHRVAISNARIVTLDDQTVVFAPAAATPPRCRRPNSSADFSSTSCPAASSRFATSASCPRATSTPAWNRRAPCCPPPILVPWPGPPLAPMMAPMTAAIFHPPTG